jgi:hypothetical protein
MDADGRLYRTADGKYVVDHWHGPTELSASELIYFCRLKQRVDQLFAGHAVSGDDDVG